MRVFSFSASFLSTSGPITGRESFLRERPGREGTVLTAIRQPVQVVKQKGSFRRRLNCVPTCVGQNGTRPRGFLTCFSSAIIEERKRVVRRTRPFLGLFGVVRAEEVHIRGLEMGVVLCVYSKVANKCANVRPCGVFGAVSELEGYR